MYCIRGGLWAGFLLCFCFLLGPAWAQTDDFAKIAVSNVPQAVEVDPTASLVKRVLPSLVNLRVRSRVYYLGREIFQESQGSGVIVSEDGYALTNYHVARQAVKIVAVDYQGKEYPTVAVATDPVLDLALLKLDTKGQLPSLPFADSDRAEVGETVLALGNPFSLGSSVSKGVISNARRIFTDRDGKEVTPPGRDDDISGLFSHWIQHDALILPGNSGGPLVDLRGRIVGINQLGGAGLGFAIPSNVASEFFQKASRGEPSTSRGWLGCTVQPAAEGPAGGATVSTVFPGSAAELAGLQSGDVLVQIGSDRVTLDGVDGVPDFYRKISELPIGKTLPLKVMRQGQPVELALTVEDLGRWTGEDFNWETLGVTLRTLTPSAAKGKKVTHGLVVTGVKVGGPWDMAGSKLGAGAVVVGIDGKPMENVDQLREVDASGSPITVECASGEYRWSTVVKPSACFQLRSAVPLVEAYSGVTVELAERRDSKTGEKLFQGALAVTRLGTAESRDSLSVGDLILEVDGRSLVGMAVGSEAAWDQALSSHMAGDKIGLKVLGHTGVRKEVELTLSRRPSTGPGATVWLDHLGVCLGESLATDEGKADQVVVKVDGLIQGSLGQLAGLREGDIVRQIDGAQVADPAAAAARLASKDVHAVVVKRDQRILEIKMEALQ